MWQLYAVKDSKSGEFGPVFQAKRDEVAVRMFSESMRGKDSMIALYPMDFALYRLCQYDEETGFVADFEVGPKLVVEGATVASLIAEPEVSHADR